MGKGLFYHSIGFDYSIVGCISCGDDLKWIFDPRIRQTCLECGGEYYEVDFYVVDGDLKGGD